LVTAGGGLSGIAREAHIAHVRQARAGDHDDVDHESAEHGDDETEEKNGRLDPWLALERETRTRNSTNLISHAPMTIPKNATLRKSPLATRVATTMLAAVIPRKTTAIAVPMRALSTPVPPATTNPTAEPTTAITRARTPP
jgi:hypothetical protein